MSCQCKPQSSDGAVLTVDLAAAVSLLEYSSGIPNLSATLLSSPGRAYRLHMLDDGSQLVSTSHSHGEEGHVSFAGYVGALLVEGSLKLSYESEPPRIVVEFMLRKPIQLGPAVWAYRFQAPFPSTTGEIIGASSITPGDTPLNIRNPGAVGLDLSCVVFRCAGRKILGTLAQCLPALAGGPKAYIACVIAKTSLGDAAEIAKCVAENCV